MSSVDSLGLAAFGCAGAFTIEILSAPNRWLLSVESQNWTLYFDMLTRDSIHKLLGFLRSHTNRTVFDELVVGSFLGAPVIIVKDDKFADRFFLKAFSGDHLIEFVLTDETLDAFVDAVAQADEEFNSGA